MKNVHYSHLIILIIRWEIDTERFGNLLISNKRENSQIYASQTPWQEMWLMNPKESNEAGGY